MFEYRIHFANKQAKEARQYALAVGGDAVKDLRHLGLTASRQMRISERNGDCEVQADRGVPERLRCRSWPDQDNAAVLISSLSGAPVDNKNPSRATRRRDLMHQSFLPRGSAMTQTNPSAVQPGNVEHHLNEF